MMMERIRSHGETPVWSNKVRGDRRDSPEDATFMKSVVDRPRRIKAGMHPRH